MWFGIRYCMDNLLKDLEAEIEGDVRFDTFSRRAYSIDASIYQIDPVGVVLPKTTEDLLTAMAIAGRHNVAVVPRGAATGIAGGCIGPGLVIDTSKYLNHIIDVDYDAETALCEPGVVQDQLNSVLAPRGYRLGADTSTGNRATLGGMLGNNSSGAHSMRYGKMVDNVKAVSLALARGELLKFSEIEWDQWQPETNTARRIRDTIDGIRSNLTDEIHRRFPKIQRRVSGYNLDEIVGNDRVNLAKLIAGSEGTLGLATDITVKISKSPKVTGLCVLHLNDLIDGLKAVDFLLQYEPYALELIDHFIVEMGQQNPVMRNRLDWLDGQPKGLLVAEFDGDNVAEVAAKLERFDREVGRESIAYSQVTLTEPAAIANVWHLRKAGLGLVMARRTNQRAIAFLEDIAVPPARVGEFMSAFRDYIGDAGKEAGFYGHAGVGCIHVRPMLDLKSEADADLMVRMMHDISDMVLEYGGAISGEHGDGLARSWLNEKMFGPEIYQAFIAVKRAFDPDNLLNPGKIVEAQPPDQNLKVNPNTRTIEVQTFLDFEPEGGLTFAAGMCNGNAECRKTTSGTMCPSFEASRDEFLSTRARAWSLASILQGDLPLDELTGKGLYDVLDLCLECKGCKHECPSQVDMAKMKAEFLYQYQQKHGVPLRSRIFGAVDRLSRIGTATSTLSNLVLNARWNRALLGTLGIAPERHLPEFARQRFSKWFHRRKQPQPAEDACKIVLFVDTWTEYNYPEIGRAAVRVLEALGYEIELCAGLCCGRPQYSKGLLDGVRSKAGRLINALYPKVEAGYRIVGLEPSCILTIKDEYGSILHSTRVADVAAACVTIDELLAESITAGRLPLQLRDEAATVRVHGHCHQKAVVGTQPTMDVLHAVPGFEVAAINSGCCGMAGSFGYEREHYEFSMQVGESRLFPAVRAAPQDAIIVADGVSCRAQIQQGTSRNAQHLVEVVAERMTEK